MAKPWQKSTNKASLSEAEPFHGLSPLVGSVRMGKEEGGIGARKS